LHKDQKLLHEVIHRERKKAIYPGYYPKDEIGI
jgi:hypothetical protein